TLIVNKLRGTFNAVACQAPGFGDRCKAILQDIAILTGGQVISEEVGLKLDSAQLSSLGKARRINVTKDDTTIVEGGGSADAIGSLDKLKLSGDEATGANILRRALVEPLRQIAQNAGAESSVVEETVKTLPKGQGYDAAKGEYTDMVKAGIIDPTKVTRSAV